MARFVVPKKSLEPPEKLPAGVYDIMFEGFKPSLTSGKSGKEKSVNLNPQMKIINNPNGELNGKRVQDFLNQNAGWIINDFCHMLGFEMQETGPDDLDIPGSWSGPEGKEQCSQWVYSGPLLGQIGKLELIQVLAKDGSGKTYTNVKRYFCKVPGCQVQHSENLAG